MPRSISLLCRKTYKLNCGITLHIPTYGEVKGECDGDIEKYYHLLSLFVTTPSDYIVELYDMGIDFQTITDEYIFFLTMIGNYSDKDYSLIFEGAKDVTWYAKDGDDGDPVIFEENYGIVIDRKAYNEISETLRLMHYKEKKHIECCNKKAFEMVVKIERKNRKIAERDKGYNELDTLTLYLVNNANFKYNFSTVRDLSIYDFLSSSKQILKAEHVDKLLIGGYSGGIDLSKIPKTELDKFKLI